MNSPAHTISSKISSWTERKFPSSSHCRTCSNRAGWSSGQVNVSGQIWSARSQHDVAIPAGAEVRVLRIEGVKVFVEAV